MTNTDLMNVSAFEGIKPQGAFASLDSQGDSLADGIGSSYGIIHYRGKNWTLKYRGETYRFNRQDDGTPLPYLDVIVLRQNPSKSKSYYPKDSWEEGATGQRPVCASIDSVRPDPDVQTPQADACALCPRNTWYNRPDGSRTRDCADYKRLAVLILPNLTKAALGMPLLEPTFLRVPPASLNDLARLAEAMERKGWHYSAYVTRIGFVPEKAHPQMTFQALQALTDAEGPVVLPMREEALAYRITGENEVGKPRAAPVAQRIATDPPPVQIAAVQPKPAAPVIDVTPVPTGFAVNNAGVQSSATTVTVLPPARIAAPAAPIEVEESHPDLDARIQNLLKT